ncbi:MAG: [FeFe] hydrogenase H-cluster radical SAM maturase HydE [Sphaerochaetaceae bacterium]|jgi:biotin synthase|nr:[FeFe] hydrogenase H-cluster radical SAM maturase HydE [Sphaerochaetaceae bacterium]MDD3164053.1 [FeFe] hydrogenase H-cluster radical SAM maturase HydE [Sphaerochaetaceae bacterium]MDD4007558.1 [FeFe] hydrogenase H-cluster radical SAM maturase HydE [Sphaerochaetaceae bacterium]MDD4396628.1 [FeFe] hydrogenase H-cluster radical SAM maturase HydE [Sphaerochaetaceae bacterium]
MDCKNLIDKLESEKSLSSDEYGFLVSSYTEEDRLYAQKIASGIADSIFGRKVYTRGIVEFTNYCRNNCLYCGIRCANRDIERYRLDAKTILSCCNAGYDIGYRTFVLQGGEDLYYTDEMMADIIRSIKKQYSDAAITLSIGERSYESYKQFRLAGADRYLLRHESADPKHFAKLHPASQVLSTRMQCLRNLKELGFQTGAGMMVGSPYQTAGNIASDLVFIQEFKPEMVGIGPFIPHHSTPFRSFPAGSVDMTLFLLSLVRIMLPKVMLPATTALGTVESDGRLRGIQAGANVIMMNISPFETRKDYLLYDSKREIDSTHLVSVQDLDGILRPIGYSAISAKGDYNNA